MFDFFILVLQYLNIFNKGLYIPIMVTTNNVDLFRTFIYLQMTYLKVL